MALSLHLLKKLLKLAKSVKQQLTLHLLLNGVNLGDKLLSAFEGRLEDVYPTEFEQVQNLKDVPAVASDAVIKASEKVAEPLVYIPIFPWYKLEVRFNQSL